MINKQRVKRIKTLIYAVIILVLLVPLIVSIVMIARVSSLSKQVDSLKTALSSQPAELPAHGADGGYVIEPEGQAFSDNSKQQENGKNNQADIPSASSQPEAGTSDGSGFLNTLPGPASLPDDSKPAAGDSEPASPRPISSQSQSGGSAAYSDNSEIHYGQSVAASQPPLQNSNPQQQSAPPPSPGNGNDNAQTGAIGDDTDNIPVKTKPDETVNTYKPSDFPELRFDTIITPLPAKKNALYLSFDNATPSQADKIINLLEKHGAKATFFIWWDSESDKDATAILRKIVEKGNSIGIYTDSNPGLYSDRDAFLKEFLKIFDRIDASTGIKTRLYRMPLFQTDGEDSIPPKRQAVLADIQNELDARGFLQYGWKASAQNAAEFSGNSGEFYEKINNSILRDGHAVITVNNQIDETMLTLEKVLSGHKSHGYEFDAIFYDTLPVSQIDE